MSFFGTVLDVMSGPALNFVGAAVASQLSNLIRIDHPMTCNFAVEIDGFIDAGFQTAEGLSDRSTPFEFDSVNMSGKVRIGPYKRQAGLVTLKKGITFRGKMEEWYYNYANYRKGAKSPEKDVSIIQLMRLPSDIPLLGNQLIEVKRWNYPKCICRDLTFPKFDADRDDISILEAIIESNKPDWIRPPTNFGQVGLLLDALVK